MALLATGAEFEVAVLDLFSGEHRTPAFLELNPFGTVPVLEVGGEVVPETGAILLCLAEHYPEAGLLPRDNSRTQALRWLFHAAAIHADFMTWRRASFQLPDQPEARDAAKAWMARRLETAFHAVDRGMTRPFLNGAFPGVAELYLLMVAGWWADRFDFATRTPDLATCLQAMTALPHVRKAYEAQGQALPRFDGIAAPGA